MPESLHFSTSNVQISQITKYDCLQSQMTTNHDCSMTQHAETTSFDVSTEPIFNLRSNSTNCNTTGLDNMTITASLTEPFQPLDPLEYRAEKSKPFFLNEKVTVMAAKQVKQRNRKIEA